MLRNPAYAGQAAYGKTHATGAIVRATRQARQRGQRSTRVSREQAGARAVEGDRGTGARDRRAVRAGSGNDWERSRVISPRNTKRPSLLQGILVCRDCGYAYYRCSTRSKNGKLREYYRCSGTDGHRRPEGRVCGNGPVRLTEVDELAGPTARTPRGPDTDPGRDSSSATDDACDAPRHRPPRRTAARPRPAPRPRCVGCLTATRSNSMISRNCALARPSCASARPRCRPSWTRSTPSCRTPRPTSKLTETLEGLPRTARRERREPDRLNSANTSSGSLCCEVLIGEDDITVRHSIPIPTGDQPPGYLLRSGSREEARSKPWTGRSRRCRSSPGGRETMTHDYKRHGTTTPVRGAGRPDRLGDRPVPPPPSPPHRVPPSSSSDGRSRGPQTPAGPSDSR